MNRTCCNKPMKLIAATWHCRVNEECNSYFDYKVYHENIKKDRASRQPKTRKSKKGINNAS